MGKVETGSTTHGRDLSRETLFYASAMIFSGLVQVAFLPFISKYLEADEAGELGILRMIAEAIAGVVVLGLPTALVRAWQRTDVPRAVLARGLLFPVVPSVLAALVVVLSRNVLAEIFSLQNADYLFHAVLLGVGIAYVQIALALPRAEGLAGRYLLMQLARGLLSLGLLAVFLTGTALPPIPSFMVSRWLPSVLLAVFASVMMWRRTSDSPRDFSGGNVTGELLRFSLPLVPATLSMIVLSSADMFMLRSIHPDLSESGYYEWASRAGMVLMPLIIGFNMAWKRFIFRKRDTGGTLGELGRAGMIFMVMVNWAALMLAMSASWLVPLVGGADYLPAARVLPTLAGATAMYGLFLVSQTGCLLTGQTGFIAWMTLFGAILNIGFNLRLIPVAGALGAAFATMATNLFMALSLFWIGRKIFPVDFLVVTAMVLPPVVFGFLAELGMEWRMTLVLAGTLVTVMVLLRMRVSEKYDRKAEA